MRINRRGDIENGVRSVDTMIKELPALHVAFVKYYMTNINPDANYGNIETARVIRVEPIGVQSAIQYVYFDSEENLHIAEVGVNTGIFSDFMHMQLKYGRGNHIQRMRKLYDKMKLAKSIIFNFEQVDDDYTVVHVNLGNVKARLHYKTILNDMGGLFIGFNIDETENEHIVKDYKDVNDFVRFETPSLMRIVEMINNRFMGEHDE